MNNQIELDDGETLTWEVYESGDGILSMVFYAETTWYARPVAALYEVFPGDISDCGEDLSELSKWNDVTYEVDADTVCQFLLAHACHRVAYSQITHAGEMETIVDTDRMGDAARQAFAWAFNMEPVKAE